MKVVFVTSVENAKPGDVKEVADGYARNYLIPRGLAKPATPAQLKQLGAQKEAESKRQAKVRADAEALAKQLGELNLNIAV